MRMCVIKISYYKCNNIRTKFANIFRNGNREGEEKGGNNDSDWIFQQWTRTGYVLFLFLSTLGPSDLRARYQRAACHGFCVAAVLFAVASIQRRLNRCNENIRVSVYVSRGNNVIIARKMIGTKSLHDFARMANTIVYLLWKIFWIEAWKYEKRIFLMKFDKIENYCK